MSQIIAGIRYHYIHIDLKLGNILVFFNSDLDKDSLNMMKAIVKIIDFWFSTFIDTSELRYTPLGSPINIGPNILK